jgi:pantetheine-phosphate adenylyltransferase
MVDILYIGVAHNDGKGKTTFSNIERVGMIRSALKEDLPPALLEKVRIVLVSEDMTVDFCDKIGATIIFRGLRNAVDFAYEQNMEQYNHDFAPHISTVFLMTPPKVAKISSSAIKSIVGKSDWETRIAEYVHPMTLKKFVQQQHIKNQWTTRIVT